MWDGTADVEFPQLRKRPAQGPGGLRQAPDTPVSPTTPSVILHDISSFPLGVQQYPCMSCSQAQDIVSRSVRRSRLGTLLVALSITVSLQICHQPLAMLSAMKPDRCRKRLRSNMKGKLSFYLNITVGGVWARLVSSRLYPLFNQTGRQTAASVMVNITIESFLCLFHHYSAISDIQFWTQVLSLNLYLF